MNHSSRKFLFFGKYVCGLIEVNSPFNHAVNKLSIGCVLTALFFVISACLHLQRSVDADSGACLLHTNLKVVMVVGIKEHFVKFSEFEVIARFKSYSH